MNYKSSALNQEKKMNYGVNWLNLPEHVLPLIAFKLGIKEYVRFGAVCRPWRSIYVENRHPSVPRLPILMFATERNLFETRSFYSLSDKRIINCHVPLPHNLLCRGSSHGWLVTLCENRTNVTLINPFTSVNNQIQLPSFANLEHNECFGLFDYLYKVVLLVNPASNPNCCKVMAIYGGFQQLAFFMLGGDCVWTCLTTTRNCKDLIYYSDQFYVVNHSGQVFAWDLNHKPAKVSTVGPPLREGDYHLGRYLVESSSGHLLQVLRRPEQPNMFAVFKLVLIESKWEKMDTLHGCVLFLGDNSSLSLPASYYPQCKPNSIYFTDDYYPGQDSYDDLDLVPHNVGVFSLEDDTVEPYYSSNILLIPVPIWVVDPML